MPPSNDREFVAYLTLVRETSLDNILGVLGFHLTPALHALEKMDVRAYMPGDALRNY
jgi:hypothetical protein